MGLSNAKFKKCAAIDDAERVRIDSSPLHCPICMGVYRKAPEVLPCGHSHCCECIARMESVAVRATGPTGAHRRAQVLRLSIECSLCRAKIPLQRHRVKNYAIEAIVDSLGAIQEDEDPLNEIIAAKNLAIKRMARNEHELANRVAQLETEQGRKVRLLGAVIGIAALYLLAQLACWLRNGARCPI